MKPLPELHELGEVSLDTPVRWYVPVSSVDDRMYQSAFDFYTTVADRASGTVDVLCDSDQHTGLVVTASLRGLFASEFGTLDDVAEHLESSYRALVVEDRGTLAKHDVLRDYLHGLKLTLSTTTVFRRSFRRTVKDHPAAALAALRHASPAQRASLRPQDVEFVLTSSPSAAARAAALEALGTLPTTTRRRRPSSPRGYFW